MESEIKSLIQYWNKDYISDNKVIFSNLLKVELDRSQPRKEGLNDILNRLDGLADSFKKAAAIKDMLILIDQSALTETMVDFKKELIARRYDLQKVL